MEKFNCIIVEDEPLAAEVLEDYIAQVPFLHLTEKCGDGIYAMEVLQREKVNVIFLDIHLPRIKGLDFVKTIKDPPQIIITSAYGEYALQGYELNVIDYLLKPIEFSRFLTAVNKLRAPAGPHSHTSHSAESHSHSHSENRPHLFFTANKKRVKIIIDDILYIESAKEYVRLVTKEKTILTKIQLSQIEEMLPKGKFLRVHRSYIVSKTWIEAFSSTELEIGGVEIPIGRNYKEYVLSLLAK
jgi:DNA-binding LytR/AlgR family response regulator